MEIKKLIDNKDYEGIQRALLDNPGLANEGMSYDEVNNTKAHPLHRICDGVFSKTYTDEEALEMANIFFAHGANINGSALIEKQDTPLLAASSLGADKVAFFYIEQGAELNHPGCHGGTALHWAAWTGRDKVVKRLIEKGAEINKTCIDFNSTPLSWAAHGLENGGANEGSNYAECTKILTEAGAV